MKSIARFQSAAGVLVADEWLALRYHPPSVLLIGTAEQTGPVIAGLLAAWPEPIQICQAANVTPDGAVRTLVLQDAGEMLLARQVALLEWMNTANDRRVIATARQPLFPRVESGEFSTALYYRLNVITIDFADVERQWLPAIGAEWWSDGGAA
jgi:hypothetical protein